MWRMLQNISREVKSCVDVSGERSEWVASQVGVRQGCVISPTLFSVFINAMAMEIREMTAGIKWGAKTFNVLLFADDVVLIAEKEEDMTRMLARAHYFSERHRFRFNVAKCKIMTNIKGANWS